MKILVIDDDKAVCYTLARVLATRGYEVITAPEGKTGVEMFRAHHPDLVITDLIMPEQEGMETIRQIRSESSDVKIIAISGGGRLCNFDMLPIAERMGADDILHKPFDAQELLQRVGRYTPPPVTSGPGD